MVPMPTPLFVNLTFSFSAKVPPENNERYDVFLPTPKDRLPSEAYKYPSVGPLIVQVSVPNPLLLIPRSKKFTLLLPLSAVNIRSEDAFDPENALRILTWANEFTFPLKSARTFVNPTVELVFSVTENLYIGFVVPIPTFESVLIPAEVFSQ